MSSPTLEAAATRRTTAAQAAMVAALVEGQASARAAFTSRTVAAVTAIYSAFAEWYSDRAVLGAAFRADAARRRGAQASANLTAAYLRQVFTVLGADPGPSGAVFVPDMPRGVDFYEQWSRPARDYRWRVTEGDDPAQARDVALARAVTMAEADVTAGMRLGAQRQLGASRARVTGYRRVIHPELSRTGTCGLCIVASDRLYHVAELLPIHEHCRCEVLPVVDGLDPLTPVPQATLEALYKAGGSTYGADLKRVRVQYAEDGELGPIMAPAGRRIRSAAEAEGARRDSAAHPVTRPPSGRTRPASGDGGIERRQTSDDDVRAQIERLERSLPAFQAMADAGDAAAVALVKQRTALIAAKRAGLHH